MKIRAESSGAALILTVAVMAILSALVTGFFTVAVSQLRSARNYADGVRADMMARAGIAAAVAQLRAQTFTKNEDPTDPWYQYDYLHGAQQRISYPANANNPGLSTLPVPAAQRLTYSAALGSESGSHSDRYTLRISDAASKINVNAGDNLAVILDNLCRVIGPPLVAADLDALQPRVWAANGADANLYDPKPTTFSLTDDQKDTLANRDIYYKLDPTTNLPITKADGSAVYGDGFAIAGYRARQRHFENINDLKDALTYVKRNTGDANVDRQLEQLEREVKFAALRDYITIDSWVDTTTVCVGKFEWIRGYRRRRKNNCN